MPIIKQMMTISVDRHNTGCNILGVTIWTVTKQLFFQDIKGQHLKLMLALDHEKYLNYPNYS